MKSTLAFTVRLLLLTVLYLLCFSIIAGLVLPRPPQAPTNEENATIFSALLALSFLNSVVLAYVIARSRWTSWKLIITICLVLFGVTTVMPQIETAVFIHNLPSGFVPRLILNGFLFALVFSPLAVLLFRKRRGENASTTWPNLSLAQWLVRLSLIAVVYVILYLSFGYFIAWQNPELVAYYGGTNPGNFFTQMQRIIRDTPWLIVLQIFRGLLWTALAIPVIRMTKGRWWEAGLAVALLFGVVMNTQLLLPNPLMPTSVRMSHLLETSTSNFVFGWVLVWLLKPLSTDALRDN